MRNVALVGFGFSLLVLQTAAATLVSMHSYAPNLMLPIAIFLGASAEVNIVRGATLCFVLGYLLDAFCGNPMGLNTFVLVACNLGARGAGLRLFPHGLAFQIFLTFLMALATGGLTLALRAIFERPIFQLDMGHSGLTLVQAAVATALLAPPVFFAVRRIEGSVAPRAEERPAPS